MPAKSENVSSPGLMNRVIALGPAATGLSRQVVCAVIDGILLEPL